MKRTLYLTGLAIALIVLPAGHSLWAQTGKMETIYSFEAPPSATYPAAGPIISDSDVIYGTTSAGGTTTGCGYFNCGTVYELNRPASPGGPWTETTLYSFGGFSGSDPQTGLVLGAGGKLYGWNRNAAFELTPPVSPGGPWTETTLYGFQGSPIDGGSPTGGMAIAADGSIYGATHSGGTYNLGTVFELTPPASGTDWTLTAL